MKGLSAFIFASSDVRIWWHNTARNIRTIFPLNLTAIFLARGTLSTGFVHVSRLTAQLMTVLYKLTVQRHNMLLNIINRI